MGMVSCCSVWRAHMFSCSIMNSGGTVTTGLVKEYFTTPSGGTSSVGAGRLNLKLDRETPVPVLTDYKINKK